MNFTVEILIYSIQGATVPTQHKMCRQKADVFENARILNPGSKGQLQPCVQVPETLESSELSKSFSYL